MSYKIFENKNVIKKIKPFLKINFLCKSFSIIYLLFYFFIMLLFFYFFYYFIIFLLFFYYIFIFLNSFLKFCSKNVQRSIHYLLLKKIGNLEKSILNFLKKKKAKSKSIKVNEMRISKKMKKKVS